MLAGINVAPHPMVHMPLDLLRQQLEVNVVAQIQVIQAGVLIAATSSMPGFAWLSSMHWTA